MKTQTLPENFMKKPTIVIHHSADFDGLFCREIARKFLPDATLIGWDYGQPTPDVPKDCALYMLDISVNGLMEHPGLIWIDHHKSAIEKFNFPIQGYRIDGVAACRLAWQWFSKWASWVGEELPVMPTKEEYITRTVVEPWSVRLAGEYDIWDKRDPDAELFQHGLRSRELSENLWELLLVLPHPNEEGKTGVGEVVVSALLDQGRAIQFAKTKENEGIIKSFGFDVEFEGLKFLACNAARYNSQLFSAGVKPEHDALLGFNYDGVCKLWRVSLYCITGKEHHDLSKIAVKYGGGGHRGACGFRSKSLPWIQ